MNQIVYEKLEHYNKLVANLCDVWDSLTKLNCGASIEQNGRRIKNIVESFL